MAVDGIAVGQDGKPRCWWGAGDDLYRSYHDSEWGRPVSDDRRLFETLCLEGFQAGLSWLTILRKRDNFRAAFAGFQPDAIARFTAEDIDRLMLDAGIVRNRAKVEATVNNARRYSDLVERFGSLAAYAWGFEPDPGSRPAFLDQATLMRIANNAESKAMSKDLLKQGWRFVGPTTVYAFMQAMGLVNDHLEGCAIRAEAELERQRFQRPSRPDQDADAGTAVTRRRP
jgi:DNA-3-methyladenine glycosylase I